MGWFLYRFKPKYLVFVWSSCFAMKFNMAILLVCNVDYLFKLNVQKNA